MQQQRQSCYYNRSATPLSPLSVGQLVWCQLEENGQWEKATIQSIHDSRSYWIKTAAGGEYRRNRIHLRPREPGAKTDEPAQQADPSPEEPQPMSGKTSTTIPAKTNNSPAVRSSERLRKKRKKKKLCLHCMFCIIVFPRYFEPMLRA